MLPEALAAKCPWQRPRSEVRLLHRLPHRLPAAFGGGTPKSATGLRRWELGAPKSWVHSTESQADPGPARQQVDQLGRASVATSIEGLMLSQKQREAKVGHV